MLRKLSQRINSEEKGFTLIELLVVILIIGILAAIALPAFLGQQKKGQDADAKSLARNMVSQVESCFAVEEDYQNCETPADSGLTYGNQPGQVQAVASSATEYAVTATTEGNRTFTITKNANGTSTRTCSNAGEGGCKANADAQGNEW
jgi:type IV pilus assembly protein PilA